MLKRTASVLFFCLSLFAFAEFDPPVGEANYFRLLSPWLLGTGTSTVSTDAPASTVWNPAAAAAAQRTTFELGYIALYDTEYDEGVAGHVVNLANTLPTKVGVFTWSGHLLSSNYEGIDLGTMGMLNLGFAKDVFEGLYVGTGLNLYAGDNDSRAFGATLDFGFIQFLGKYRALNNFRWGIVAKDVGLPYDATAGKTAVPAPFTLQGGAAFTPIEKEKLSLDLHGDISVPSFQSFRIDAGILANFDNFIQLGLSSAVDFGSLADGDFDTYRWIPSVGLRFSFQTDLPKSGALDLSGRGWEKGDIQPQIGVAPLAGGAWGIGTGVTIPLGIIDEAPPEIELDLGDLPYQEAEADEVKAGGPVALDLPLRGIPLELTDFYAKPRKAIRLVQDTGEKTSEKESPEKNNLIKIPGAIYLSPNNDGVKDDLSFPFAIAEDRYVKGYELVVRNEADEIVRAIGNKEERPNEVTFKEFLKRIFARKSGIPIPETLRWDGTTEAGTLAPDGIYSFSVSAWDDNGNRSQTDWYPVVIDTRPPEVNVQPIAPLELIFSPNEDGNKDELEIEQDGTLEEDWRIQISTLDGKELFRQELRDAEPATFVWNGKDTGGEIVPDGIYAYTISATDRAGNSGDGEVQNIIVDTRPTPVGISINSGFFSPNGDGVQDQILFSLDTPNPASIMAWELEVADASGTVRRRTGGATAPAGEISFDGRSDAGTLLPEGRYTARYSALYQNGNAPFQVSPPFILDITAPRASLAASPSIFSPNGDGNRDTLVINQDSSVEQSWVGRIVDSAGRTVREYTWIEQPEERISWNGTSSAGEIVPDGDYRYLLSSTDLAGNSLRLESKSFRVSTGETVVALFTDTDAFSPNGDGIKDEILLKPRVKVAEGVESYSISVLNEREAVVKAYRGNGSLSPDYRFDGIGDDGTRLPDGRYSARIQIMDRNGTPAESFSESFSIDREAPRAVVTAPYLLFSPDGDGNKDQIVFSQSGSSELVWEGEILNTSGTAVKSYRWKGSPGGFTWLGRDDAGNQVADGRYRYRLRSTDPAGNRAEVLLEGLNLDSRATTAYLTTDGSRISPNGDGRFDQLRFYPIVSLQDGIESWTLSLADSSGNQYARFEGSGKVPKEIVWNGADADGRVRDGMYTPRLSVRYLKGNNPVAELKPLRVDVTTPAVSLKAVPLPFSPDNDDIEDELRISISVEDLSPVENWRLDIFDRQMNLFNRFTGSGAPAEELIWDGRSNTGELVISAEDYPFRLTVSDDLANTTVIEGKFPVDVLVIRDGDKLKIQIASIVFEPNTAEFSIRDEETAEKNTFVLNRIAEILSKYRNYRITIEGHANPVYFYDPKRAPVEEEEELKPLSRDRALAVRGALVERGVNPNRLSVVGKGGSTTIADPGNREVNWKNRRVEFILEK